MLFCQKKIFFCQFSFFSMYKRIKMRRRNEKVVDKVTLRNQFSLSHCLFIPTFFSFKIALFFKKKFFTSYFYYYYFFLFSQKIKKPSSHIKHVCHFRKCFMSELQTYTATASLCETTRSERERKAWREIT